jgi:hypothetical protein
MQPASWRNVSSIRPFFHSSKSNSNAPHFHMQPVTTSNFMPALLISTRLQACLIRMKFPLGHALPRFGHTPSSQIRSKSTPAPSSITSEALQASTLRSAEQPNQNGPYTATLDCNKENLGEYTSGRWLWDEKEQFSRRRV